MLKMLLNFLKNNGAQYSENAILVAFSRIFVNISKICWFVGKKVLINFIANLRSFQENFKLLKLVAYC